MRLICKLPQTSFSFPPPKEIVKHIFIIFLIKSYLGYGSINSVQKLSKCNLCWAWVLFVSRVSMKRSGQCTHLSPLLPEFMMKLIMLILRIKDYHLTKTVANSRLSLHYLILIALQISKNFLPFLVSFSMLPLSVPLVLYSGWVCVWSPWWWLWMWELPLWNPLHGLRVVAILKLKYKFHRSIYLNYLPFASCKNKNWKKSC